MFELRLHVGLYAPDAIDEAVRVFSPYGEIEVEEAPPYRVVRVSAGSAEREKSIAGELGNYALGTTVSATTDASDVESDRGDAKGNDAEDATPAGAASDRGGNSP